MKKLIVGVSIISIFLCNGLIFGQSLKPNESAIFLRNGNMIMGEIIDISSTRRVLQLKDGTEIKLTNIWMINFINTKWNFPGERKQIKTADHYFFLKNGSIIYGKIIDFSSNLRVFELDTGKKIKINAIRRIYFSEKVPNQLRKEIEKIATIFLKDGTTISGEIVDFSLSRRTLVLKDGNEIKLSAIDMINYVNKGRSFPAERSRIVNSRIYYIFLKDGGVITGRIIGFDSNAFILASGERLNVSSIKRIYFPKSFFPIKRKIIKR